MRKLARLAPALLAAAPLPLAAVPALAQDHHHDMSAMPGMDHSAHDMAGMDMSGGAPSPAPAPVPAAEPAAQAPADDTPGNAAPPPVPTDHPADRFFSTQRMAPARAALMHEGQWRGSAVELDRFELRTGSGHNGYAWKAQGWYGSELNRLVLATEGEGNFGEPAERAELRAVVRHAIAPYFNLEAGVRQDFRPEPRRTYAVLGVEGLAPYWIETEAELFVSNKGDVHLRFSASHDLRLSGPLVLQPEAELNLAMQDVPALGIGSGVERLEAGARLRYEIRPEFAPFIGVNWERSFGGTARAARAAGERASAVTAVLGIHAFF